MKNPSPLKLILILLAVFIPSIFTILLLRSIDTYSVFTDKQRMDNYEMYPLPFTPLKIIWKNKNQFYSLVGNAVILFNTSSRDFTVLCNSNETILDFTALTDEQILLFSRQSNGKMFVSECNSVNSKTVGKSLELTNTLDFTTDQIAISSYKNNLCISFNNEISEPTQIATTVYTYTFNKDLQFTNDSYTTNLTLIPELCDLPIKLVPPFPIAPTLFTWKSSSEQPVEISIPGISKSSVIKRIQVNPQYSFVQVDNKIMVLENSTGKTTEITVNENLEVWSAFNSSILLYVDEIKNQLVRQTSSTQVKQQIPLKGLDIRALFPNEEGTSVLLETIDNGYWVIGLPGDLLDSV